MTLLDGFLVALDITVVTVWVWRRWPFKKAAEHIGPLFRSHCAILASKRG